MKFNYFIRIVAAFFLLLFIATSISAQQNWDTLPWKSYSDYKMQNLNKSFVATNILYDRMFPLANVDEYTGLPETNNDTTHPDHVMQAYYEMYNAAYNTTGMISPNALDDLIKTNGNSKQHPIGIFLYKFNTLDTNALQDHLIDTLANGQFIDVANRPRSPYFTNTSFLASPLLADGQIVEEGDHEFYLDPQFFLHNENFTIQTITVDFGDGTAPWVVTNPYGNPQARGGLAGIFKKLGKTILGRIVVVGVDILGYTIRYGSPFKLFVKNTKTYAPLTFCKGGGQKWVIEAPQARLDLINTQYGNPQVDYTNADNQPVKDTAYFYFAGNGSSCNTNVLSRPVVFIDGFDPTNSRNVQKIYEDYINVEVTRQNTRKFFGDYMLNEGYDFVILDFKHGNDLLERNAMTVVSLIERLNQTYGSTMQQGITLIGPSMGSLIAQYALAYMEANNIPHNVKDYISFDGCHQGANVPIGLQNYVEYFTKKGIFKKNKAIRDGLYNGLAARQMLAHHVSANSQFPAPDALRTKFLQNLTAVNEYPQLCRKVALINGTNTGQLNPFHPNPSETLLRIYTQRKGWKSLWGLCQDKICMKLDWECKTTPNNGTAKVMENWTVEPLFNLLFWVPLGKTNKYADAAWGNSSQDNAPGGTFGTFFGTNPGDIKENDFVFLLKETMYLLTGSKRTSFTQNINEFTMMPSYSSADLRFPNKNLYMRWDNQYLCGKTPFDYVYAPPANERHVFVSAAGSQYFENEVRCNNADLPKLFNPNITGSSSLCFGSQTYSIETCTTAPFNVTWTATPSGIVSLTPNGATVTVTKVGNGSVTLKATNSNTCQSNFSITKNIRVGTYLTSEYTIYPSVSPPYCWGTTVQFGLGYWMVPEATGYQWMYSSNWQYVSGQGTRVITLRARPTSFPSSGSVSLRVSNICGGGNIMTPINYAFQPNCTGARFAISPNPTSEMLTIDQIDDAKTGKTPKSEIQEVELIDKMGTLQFKQKFGKGLLKTTILINNLPDDVYTIRIFDGDSWYIDKIIIQHQ